MLAKQTPGLMQATLDRASKIELIRKYAHLTPKRIIQEDYPNIVALAKEHGLDTVEKCLAIHLKDLSMSFGDELTNDQIFETVAEITSSQYKNLTMEDIYLCLREIKFSKSFGKLNTNKMLNKLEEYYCAKIPLIEQECDNQVHRQLKQGTQEYNPEAAERFKQIAQRLRKNMSIEAKEAKAKERRRRALLGKDR